MNLSFYTENNPGRIYVSLDDGSGHAPQQPSKVMPFQPQYPYPSQPVGPQWTGHTAAGQGAGHGGHAGHAGHAGHGGDGGHGHGHGTFDSGEMDWLDRWLIYVHELGGILKKVLKWFWRKVTGK